MGRSFDIEIDNLSSTYQYAMTYNDTEILDLSGFLLGLHDKPLFIVGSGGSFSTAKALEYLHCCSKIPGTAKAITPLELADCVSSIRNAGVILITANGNNNDTVNAFKLITRGCPSSFLCICDNVHIMV